MMMLLFFHDGGDDSDCPLILPRKLLQLHSQMFQHHPFNGHGGGRNELAPQHSGQKTQDETAGAT
ncbi:hypothetical protein D3C73_1653230 [compost metagenome]